MTFEDIQKANEQIRTITLTHKDKTGKLISKEYSEVNQRIKAFRMCYPEGCIKTEMLSNADGVCVFKAEVYSEYRVDERHPIEGLSMRLLATGYAYEKESSSYINKTSYIENCETSAVGRALGMCGFGIDTSVASAEEVMNAQLNQSLEKKYIKALDNACKKAGRKPSELEALEGVTSYDEITMPQYMAAMKEVGAE